MQKNYRKTLAACYLGFITQAITANFAPLLFLKFHADYHISLGQIALIPTAFFLTQLLVDVFCAWFVDAIGYRRSVILSEITSGLGLAGLAVIPDLFSDPFTGILVCVIIYAIGSGLIEVVVSPIVEACPFEHKDAVMSLLHSFYCWGSVGVILLSTLLFRVLGDESMRFLWSVEGQVLYVGDGILVPIIGGLMEAVGLSLILLRGGSTGGTDILALIVNKFWPITLGRFYVMADLIIITLLIFVPGHCFTDVVYGYITMGVCAYVLDLIMLGKESAVQVLIFSNHYEAIGNYVTKEMERGVTALKAIGWYTQEDRKVLMVMIRKTEMAQLVKAVKEVDPKAFVTVVPANNVYGEGFGEMKTGLPLKKKK